MIDLRVGLKFSMSIWLGFALASPSIAGAAGSELRSDLAGLDISIDKAEAAYLKVRLDALKLFRAELAAVRPLRVEPEVTGSNAINYSVATIGLLGGAVASSITLMAAGTYVYRLALIPNGPTPPEFYARQVEMYGRHNYGSSAGHSENYVYEKQVEPSEGPLSVSEICNLAEFFNHDRQQQWDRFVEREIGFPNHAADLEDI